MLVNGCVNSGSTVCVTGAGITVGPKSTVTAANGNATVTSTNGVTVCGTVQAKGKCSKLTVTNCNPAPSC